MNRLDALESIKRALDDPGMPLDERASSVSSDFYSAGLDLGTAAAYINATPSELEALLELGGLDEDLLSEIAAANPPRTAWTFLNCASEDEARRSLEALTAQRGRDSRDRMDAAEAMYRSMVAIAEPTADQRVAALSGADIRHALEKARQYKADDKFMVKFMTSVAGQRGRGKVLSDKQSSKLRELLEKIADAGAICRDSIDGDADACDRILDALGR